MYRHLQKVYFLDILHNSILNLWKGSDDLNCDTLLKLARLNEIDRHVPVTYYNCSKATAGLVRGMPHVNTFIYFQNNKQSIEKS